jgi:hypothetical protein
MLKRTKVISFRVEVAHVPSINAMIKKFLKTKNYKFYAKRKIKTK